MSAMMCSGSHCFGALLKCNYDSSPYRDIVSLSEQGMECGQGNDLEQGGRHLKWSYLQTISRHTYLIPKPKIFW